MATRKRAKTASKRVKKKAASKAVKAKRTNLQDYPSRDKYGRFVKKKSGKAKKKTAPSRAKPKKTTPKKVAVKAVKHTSKRTIKKTAKKKTKRPKRPKFTAEQLDWIEEEVDRRLEKDRLEIRNHARIEMDPSIARLDGRNRQDWLQLYDMFINNDEKWQIWLNFCESIDLSEGDAADAWFSPDWVPA